jgi:response regulator RpfG family c-di-GMP phosphodiesterase
MTKESKSVAKETAAGNDEHNKPSTHYSLTQERNVLVVDQGGERREETVDVIQRILPHATIQTVDTPEEAESIFEENEFDTCVVNFLMPGYSSSNFVKTVANQPKNTLLVGFSADKLSDAYDTKKGIKIKPLSKIFEREMPKEEEEKSESTDES